MHTAVSILLAFAVPFQAQVSTTPKTLESLRDRSRPLLIFAPPGDPRLPEQIRLLTAHRADLIERQIMLVPEYRNYAGGGDWEITALMGNEEPTLRKRFHIHPDEFTVVLLGKDGGEKFRSHTPVTIERLNQLIDAMPMRRQEMQSRPSR